MLIRSRGCSCGCVWNNCAAFVLVVIFFYGNAVLSFNNLNEPWKATSLLKSTRDSNSANDNSSNPLENDLDVAIAKAKGELIADDPLSRKSSAFLDGDVRPSLLRAPPPKRLVRYQPKSTTTTVAPKKDELDGELSMRLSPTTKPRRIVVAAKTDMSSFDAKLEALTAARIQEMERKGSVPRSDEMTFEVTTDLVSSPKKQRIVQMAEKEEPAPSTFESKSNEMSFEAKRDLVSSPKKQRIVQMAEKKEPAPSTFESKSNEMSFEAKRDLVSSPKKQRIVQMAEKEEPAPSTFESKGNEMSFEAKRDLVSSPKKQRIVQMAEKKEPAPSTFESKGNEMSFEAKSDLVPPTKQRIVKMAEKEEPPPSTFESKSNEMSFEAKTDLVPPTKQRIVKMAEKEEPAPSTFESKGNEMSFEAKSDLVSSPKKQRIVKMAEKEEPAPSTFETKGNEMSFEAKIDLVSSPKKQRIVKMAEKEEPAPSTFETKGNEMSFEPKAEVVSGAPKRARIVQMPEKTEYAPSTFERNGSEMSFQAKAEFAKPATITKIVQMPEKKDFAPSTFESKTSEISFEAKADSIPPKKTKLVEMPKTKEPAPSTFQASNLGDIAFEAKPELESVALQQRRTTIETNRKESELEQATTTDSATTTTTTKMMTPLNSQGSRSSRGNQGVTFEPVGGTMFDAAVGNRGDNSSSPPPKKPASPRQSMDDSGKPPRDAPKPAAESDESTKGTMFDASLGGSKASTLSTEEEEDIASKAVPITSNASKSEVIGSAAGSMFVAALEGSDSPSTENEEDSEEPLSSQYEDDTETFMGTMFEAVVEDVDGEKPSMSFPKQGERKAIDPRVVKPATDKRKVPPPANAMFRSATPKVKSTTSTSMFQIKDSESPKASPRKTMFRMKEPEQPKPPPSNQMFRMKESETKEVIVPSKTVLEAQETEMREEIETDDGDDAVERETPEESLEAQQAQITTETPPNEVNRPMEDETKQPEKKAPEASAERFHPPLGVLRADDAFEETKPPKKLIQKKASVQAPKAQAGTTPSVNRAVETKAQPMFQAKKAETKAPEPSTEMFKMRRQVKQAPPSTTSMFRPQPIRSTSRVQTEAKVEAPRMSVPKERTVPQQRGVQPDKPQGIGPKSTNAGGVSPPVKVIRADAAFEAKQAPKKTIEKKASLFQSSSNGMSFETNNMESERLSPPRRVVKATEKKIVSKPKLFSSESDGMSFEAKPAKRPNAAENTGKMFEARRRSPPAKAENSPIPPPKKASTPPPPPKRRLVPFTDVVKSTGAVIGSMFRPRVQGGPSSEELERARLAEDFRRQEKARVENQMRLSEERRIREENARAMFQAQDEQTVQESEVESKAPARSEEVDLEDLSTVEEETMDVSIPYDATIELAYEKSDKTVPYNDFKITYLKAAVADVVSKREKSKTTESPADVSIPYDATVLLAYEESDKSIPYESFKKQYLEDAIAYVVSKQKNPEAVESEIDTDLSIPYDATVLLAYEKSDKSIPYEDFQTKYLRDAIADVISKQQTKAPPDDSMRDKTTKNNNNNHENAAASSTSPVSDGGQTIRRIPRTQKSYFSAQESGDGMNFSVTQRKTANNNPPPKTASPAKVAAVVASKSSSSSSESINSKVQASTQTATAATGSALFRPSKRQGTFESDGNQFVYKTASEKRLSLARKVAAQMIQAREEQQSSSSFAADDSGMNMVIVPKKKLVKPATTTTTTTAALRNEPQQQEALPQQPRSGDSRKNGSMTMTSSATANAMGNQPFGNIRDSKLNVGATKPTGLDVQKFAKFVGDGLQMVLEESQKRAITMEEAKRQKKDRERKKVFGFDIGPSESEMAAHLMEEGKHLAVEGGKHFAKFASDGLQMVYHAAEKQTKEYMALKKSENSRNTDPSTPLFYASEETPQVKNEDTVVSPSVSEPYFATKSQTETNPEEIVPTASASSMLRTGGRLFAKFVGDGLQMVQKVASSSEKRYRRPPKE